MHNTPIRDGLQDIRDMQAQLDIAARKFLISVGWKYIRDGGISGEHFTYVKELPDGTKVTRQRDDALAFEAAICTEP